MTKIDMAFGNPSFLFEYWKGEDLPDLVGYYPSPYMNERIRPELQEAIRNIHRAVGNVQNIEEYNIVVGNGATQLLSAILYETYGTRVSAPIPYFLRFPVIAQLGANAFVENAADKMIVTVPNNPTGDFAAYDNPFTVARTEIIDACYNWPQYCDTRAVDDDIILFSLSKATGHAGTRFGWALIKDEELAKRVTTSVEMSTMGVSDMTLEVARFVLTREAVRHNRGDETIFSFGKKVLDGRWVALLSSKLPFKILNKNGMFLYAEGEIPAHVEGILGSRFGDSNKNFRLNVGCTNYQFSQFIREYEE